MSYDHKLSSWNLQKQSTSIVTKIWWLTRISSTAFSWRRLWWKSAFALQILLSCIDFKFFIYVFLIRVSEQKFISKYSTLYYLFNNTIFFKIDQLIKQWNQILIFQLYEREILDSIKLERFLTRITFQIDLFLLIF